MKTQFELWKYGSISAAIISGKNYYWAATTKAILMITHCTIYYNFRDKQLPRLKFDNNFDYKSDIKKHFK